MPNNPLFEIRPMVRDDLEQAFSLSVNEGWNQTEKDWRLLLDNPANTCIVAEKDNRIRIYHFRPIQFPVQIH